MNIESTQIIALLFVGAVSIITFLSFLWMFLGLVTMAWYDTEHVIYNWRKDMGDLSDIGGMVFLFMWPSHLKGLRQYNIDRDKNILLELKGLCK
jgi:hypothetical protein